MRKFLVATYRNGVLEADSFAEVEASDPLAAANFVTGEELRETGGPGDLRAEVRPVGQPEPKSLFYTKPI